MKKSLTTIFSLSLLLSIAHSALGECSMDQKKSIVARKGCTPDCRCTPECRCTPDCRCTADSGKKAFRSLPDIKKSVRRLTNAGMIAGIALVADPIFKEIFANALVEAPISWITNKIPFMNNDRLAKVCALLFAAGGGACIIKNKLAKKMLSLFECR